MARNMIQYLHFRILKFPWTMYPLVNVYIAMEKAPCLVGNSSINRPFSIAILFYWRVNLKHQKPLEHSLITNYDPHDHHLHGHLSSSSSSLSSLSSWPLLRWWKTRHHHGQNGKQHNLSISFQTIRNSRIFMYQSTNILTTILNLKINS